MNTLKSGTTIVVLLGVLYGVYVVLSKPDRLREFPLPGASTSATNDPGPSIEFSAGTPAGHGHAEPHLAVETGAAHGLGVASSPASPALPSPVGAPPELSRPAAPSAGMAAGGAPNSSLGAGSSAGSAYGSSSPAASSYGASLYGSSPSASGGGSSYGASTPGYGGGSRYNITSASTAGVSDAPPAEGGVAQAGSAYSTGVQTAGPDVAGGGVQPAYGVNSGLSNGSAGAVAGASAEVKSDALTEYSLRQMWAQAEQLVAETKFKEALALLSTHYSNPAMPAEHREAMVPWLDALAAKVIYSKQHLLELPYEARAKETLFDIQERFNVPWQLLQNINSDVVKDPQLVVAGTQLKVVKGPFRAEVELGRGQLTVYLNELYAGRFAFTVGSEMPRPGPGPYKVVDKRLDRVYYGRDGQTIPASDPTNPYGGVWMDLGQEMSIHGSPLQPTGGAPLGCISLSPQDAKDVYGILSLSSEVVIR